MSEDYFAELDSIFGEQLRALVAASGGKIWINSGYRTVERQQQLWDEALKKYGDPEIADNYVARPGTSNHNRGLAADLGGDLELAARLAPQFGLKFPMSHEPWHIELATSKSSSATSSTSTGVSAMAVEPDVLTPQSTPAQIEAYIKKTYPQIAPFLGNEEIRNLLLRPDIEDMDDTEIEALIRNTTYWQTHGPESRSFDALIANDGNAAGALVDKTMGLVADIFARNGVAITREELGRVAKTAIRSGWVSLQGQIVDQGGLRDMVAAVMRIGTNQGAALTAGEAKASADALGQIARSYMVPMAQRDLDDWALKILEGSATEESFKSYITGISKGRFIGDKDIVAAIDSGLSPSDYFAPIRNIVAQTLELNPESVDFNDSKYMGLIQMFDQNLGQKRSMTLGEAAQWARNQPGFSNTTQYRQTNADFALKMAQTFGGIA